MSAQANLLAQLDALIEKGGLPRSACGAAFLEAVRPLLDSGVVVEERSGAGRILAIRDLDALQAFRRRRFPNVSITPGTLSRIEGLGRFRDSKTLASDTPEIVSVRAWSEAALTRQGKPAGAASATARHGLFSFFLNEGYRFHGSCALVENPALFSQFEKLGLPAALVIYGGGRTSSRFLEWLKSALVKDATLLHLPDYDPVGLSEFVRLRAVLQEKVVLHVPADLERRFSTFSNAGLLRKPNTQAMLANLRNSEVLEVRNVMDWIARHNAGLEQEALLLPLDS